MELILLEDWKCYKKGATLEVWPDVAKKLIKDKIASKKLHTPKKIKADGNDNTV